MLNEQEELIKIVGALPMVTIGVPLFNNELTVAKTIESVIKQNYPNIEVVLSDDYSTDNTYDICISLTRDFKNIRIVKQAENLGLYKNFKFVLDEAKGQYFMWLCGDDSISEDYISNNVYFLAKNLEYVSAYSLVLYDYMNGVKIGHDYNFEHSFRDRLRSFFEDPFQSHGILFSLIRTDVLRKFPGLGKSYFAADWFLDLYLLHCGKIRSRNDGYLLLGTNGVSKQVKSGRLFMKNKIGYIFPFSAFMSETITYFFRAKPRSLIDLAALIKHLSKLQYKNSVNTFTALMKTAIKSFIISFIYIKKK